jgi:hypothetical protein
VSSYGSTLSNEIHQKTQMHSDEAFGFAAFADYATQPISQVELELLTTRQAVAGLWLSCTECVMDGFERHAASTLKILMRRAIQAQVILAARLEFHR